MMTREYNPTEGRVYGGDCGLIHIADGERANMGRAMARDLDKRMRADAVKNKMRNVREAMIQNLCPGCYMVALFNAAVQLAKENGQSLSELGNSMATAFRDLAEGGEDRIEHINVMLDDDDDLGLKAMLESIGVPEAGVPA